MWYTEGTVQVANGSSVVVGTGTKFVQNCRVGDALLGPDGGWYEVTNIPSETTLGIKPDYRGVSASAAAFSVAPMQGYIKQASDRLNIISLGMQGLQETIDSTIASRDAAAASAAAALASKNAAGTSETNSATNVVTSQKWASNAEDVVVSSGLYSSLHYSRKSAASATASAGSATASAGSATAASGSAAAALASKNAAAVSETNAAASAGQAANKLPLAGGIMTGAIRGPARQTIASATVLPVSNASNSYLVTGSVSIGYLETMEAGTRITLVFNDPVTLSHGTSASAVSLIGGANIAALAGDTTEFLFTGTLWRQLWFQRATGAPVNATTSTLDGTAGRSVKVGDFGVGGNAVAWITSINNITLSGFYSAQGGGLGAPAAGNGLLEHIQHPDPGYAYQTWASLTQGLGVWSRSKQAGVWGTWQRNERTGDIIPQITSGSIDSLGPGTYRLTSDVTGGPSGNFANGTLVTIYQADGVVYYDYYGIGGGKQQARRGNPWQSVYTSANALGTVINPSSGNGSIIETGANTNGRYTKFIDGTLICTHSVATDNATMAVGSLFGSNAYGGSGFPSAFSGTPLVTASSIPSGTNVANGLLTSCYLAPGINNWGSWRSLSVQSLAYATIINLHAIGRWY